MRDLDYFIEKFEAIPEEQWTTGKYRNAEGRCCALGHCGKFQAFVDTEEAKDLYAVIARLSPRPFSVGSINDNVYGEVGFFFGTTPKARIVNYLKAVKEYWK